MTNIKQLIAEAKEKGISFRNVRFGRPSMSSKKPSLRLTKSYITINEPASSSMVNVSSHLSRLLVRRGSDNLGYKVNRNKNAQERFRPQRSSLVMRDSSLAAQFLEPTLALPARITPGYSSFLRPLPSRIPTPTRMTRTATTSRPKQRSGQKSRMRSRPSVTARPRLQRSNRWSPLKRGTTLHRMT